MKIHLCELEVFSMIYGNFQTETGVLRQQTYKKQGNVMLKKINKFLKNTSGNILPTMGILAVPLTIAAAAAVDYTRYVNMRTEVQSGLDAAGIATISAINDIKISIPSDLEGEAFDAELEKRLNEYAKSFLDSNITSSLAKESYTYEINYNPPTSNTEGGVSIVAEIDYDTIFGGINGKDGGIILFNDKISDTITSVINTGNRTVEVALVVDNSGSMALQAGNLGNQNNPAPVANRRITKLQEAANQLVEDVFNAAKDSQLPDPVQFSIVPFSSTVNVGKLDHDNHKDGNAFLDINGFTSYNNENLDWKNTYRANPGETVNYINNNRTAVLTKSNGTTENLTRLNIFEMLGIEWEGCVEMRPWPHNIRDSYRNNRVYSQTNSERLFVPYMVPDAPDSSYFDIYLNSGEYIRRYNDNPSFGSRFFSGNYIPDFYDYDPESQLAFPIFNGDDDQFGSSVDDAFINAGQIKRTNWIHKYQAYTGLVQNKIDAIPNNPLRNEQLKDILNDLEIPSFEKNLNATNGSYFADSGPNAFCPDIPILQLTDDKATIKNTIDNMQAHGGTNIQQGLTWGWRTLSDLKPFTGGRSITDVQNRKILILLTDGNNQLLPENTRNNTRYSAWGYQRTDNILKNATTNENSHRRLLRGIGQNARRNTIYESQFTLNTNPTTQAHYEDIMNLHTNQACNNIKAAGISIYTIAFDVPATGKVKDLLEHCAGSGIVAGAEIVRGVQFYHDVVGLQLQDTFAEIAQSISAIRIAQ